MCSYNQPTHSGSSWSCTLFVVVVICLFFPGRKKEEEGRTSCCLLRKSLSLFFSSLSLATLILRQKVASLARWRFQLPFFFLLMGAFSPLLWHCTYKKVCQPTFSVKPGRGIAETRKGQSCISEMKSVGGFCTFTFPGERKRKGFVRRLNGIVGAHSRDFRMKSRNSAA